MNPPARVRDMSVFGDPVTGCPDLADKYAGLDLSLTGNGTAALQHGRMFRALFGSNLRGVGRLDHLRAQLNGGMKQPLPKLVAIELYSFGSTNGMARIGEWGGVARLVLFDAGVPFIEVPPTTLKKFVTGGGAAEKSGMALELLKRFGIDEPQNDKADAAGLALFALEFDRPGSLTLTKLQREAVDKFRKELAEGKPARKKTRK
jgi:Holliday junction resolvasome RuvABC endonuclease subunit